MYESKNLWLIKIKQKMLSVKFNKNWELGISFFEIGFKCWEISKL